MKLPKQTNGLTFDTKRRPAYRDWKDTFRALLSICDSLPSNQATALFNQYIKMSAEEQQKEEGWQALILQKYPPAAQNTLRNYFAEIKQRSHQYQVRAMEIAKVYLLHGKSVNANLHGTGDNCYEYALGDLFDAYGATDDVWNPGFTVEEDGYWLSRWNTLPEQSRQVIQQLRKDVDAAYTLTTSVINNQQVQHQNLASITPDLWRRKMTIDANFFGKKITPVNFVRGSYVAKPNTILFAGVYYEQDYHYYRYEPQYGLWSHKRGCTPVIATDASHNLIFDPQSCDRGPYRLFMGYFELS